MRRAARRLGPAMLTVAFLVPLVTSAPAPEPLPGARPPWLDAAQEAELRRGGSVLLAGGTVLGPLGQVIQPGAWMIEPSWCTLNFVFESRTSPGRYAVGTAGHCAREGDRASLFKVVVNEGPVVLATSERFGTVVRSVSGGVGNDFALIEVDAALAHRVDPTVRLIGGPCGVYEGPASSAVYLHYGHGVVVGTGGTARAGLGMGGHDSAVAAFQGLAYYGDSGSPIRVEAPGERGAVGVQTHVQMIQGPLPLGAPLSRVYGTSISKVLSLVGDEWRLLDGADCS